MIFFNSPDFHPNGLRLIPGKLSGGGGGANGGEGWGGGKMEPELRGLYLFVYITSQ